MRFAAFEAGRTLIFSEKTPQIFFVTTMVLVRPTHYEVHERKQRLTNGTPRSANLSLWPVVLAHTEKNNSFIQPKIWLILG